MKLFSNTFSALEQSLTYSSLKQKVISQNIANVDTPNYKAKDVRFKDKFQQAFQQTAAAYRTDARHFAFKQLPSAQIGVITRSNVQYNQNGNSVDLDKEMSESAMNQIYYNALIERLNGKFSTLENVIRGGK